LSNAWSQWQQEWQPTFLELASHAMAQSDAGHDIQHIRRVVVNCERLGQAEVVDPYVVFPAAWLHDCVSVPKNSPLRSQASRLAADQAVELLRQVGYPEQFRAAIHHCIVAHSFSANVPCETREAKLVQDADRLEAIGAIGIARCLMTGGSLGQRLYDPDQPLPIDRPAQDFVQSVDHFFAKLFKLPATMQTESGRREAERRTQIMQSFLEQLCIEIGEDPSQVRRLIDTVA
jgi:uncharacterized protein